LGGKLGSAKLTLQVDVGFGDAIIPEPNIVAFPTLLDLPGPKLRAYRRETVVAEKLHAMVTRGMTNSRMKTTSTFGSFAASSSSTAFSSDKQSSPRSSAETALSHGSRPR
jgi:hypothetical protein